MKKWFVAVTSASLLVGCGSFVPVAKLGDLTPTQKNKVQSLEIFSASQLLNTKFKVLTVVEGNSCQNKIWDPAATRPAAIDQLKYFAAEAGADGIANIQCGAREGTSSRTNCWELISCTAEAIKLTN